MDFFECAMGRRSCRRFKQTAIPREKIDRIIDAGRYVPSGFNVQTLRFAAILSPGKVARAFGFTGWLTGQPPEGERPVAYIAVCNDDQAARNEPAVYGATVAVMMAAHALGYGSCWHGVKGNEEFKALLGAPDDIAPHVLISLGKPHETFQVHDPATDHKVRKDGQGVVQVGKRGRNDSIIAVL